MNENSKVIEEQYDNLFKEFDTTKILQILMRLILLQYFSLWIKIIEKLQIYLEK